MESNTSPPLAGNETGIKAAFQNSLVKWFTKNAKNYPWRRTIDPYAILVSEMMLQQTQVATVLGRGYFGRWMEAFPTALALAKASEQQILSLWEGLGYYSRARNLQKAAQVVVEQHDGEFPKDLNALLTLPGLGLYTAGAVATFAFDQPVPIVDANIARVLSRLFSLEEPIDEKQGRDLIWHWATTLVPLDKPGRYNAALMELGQQICINREPQCQVCPVAAFCFGKAREPARLPLKKARRETEFTQEYVAWCVSEHGLLMHQETGKRRGGLWKLPEREESFFTRCLAKQVYAARYSITHYRVQLAAYEVPARRMILEPGDSWVPLSKLKSTPMASPYRKAVECLS